MSAARAESVEYDCATGFFSVGSLVRAASGVAGLFGDGGHMLLILGACDAPRELLEAYQMRVRSGKEAIEDMLVKRCLEASHGCLVERELVDRIEEYVKSHPEAGYKSLVDFVTEAIRRRAEELRMFAITPRFEHVNTYEDRVQILDRKIGPRAIVTLHIKSAGETGFKLHCEHCGRTNCEHILYATTIPEVMRPAEKKGWKYKGEYGEI